MTKDNRISRCSTKNVLVELQQMVKDRVVFIPTFFLLCKYQADTYYFRFNIRHNDKVRQYTICRTNDVHDLKMVKVFLVKWFNCINQKENESRFTVEELQAIRANVNIILNIRIRVMKSVDIGCCVKEEIKDDQSINQQIANTHAQQN